MKKGKIIALTLGVLVASTMIMEPTMAVATSKDKINSEKEINNEKIDDLEEKKDGLQASKTESEKKVQEARDNFNAQNKLLTEVKDKVFAFEDEISQLQGKIDGFEAKIVKTEEEINAVKVKIDEKQKELEFKEETLGKRLRSTYMNNVGDRMLYMILDSKNLGDLISNVANINILIQTDQELIADIEADKVAIEVERTNLVKKEAGLTASKKEVEGVQAEVVVSKEKMEVLEAEYAEEATKLKALEDAKTAEYDALTAEEKAIQHEITHLEIENVNLDKELVGTSVGTSPTAPPSGGSSGSGSTSSTGFIRPVGGYISSPYGYRVHPISGVSKLHGGIDFAVGSGTPIKAIASGVVKTAGWHNAFGNMVIVDHQNGFTSLYAHASSLNVRAGQTISQGQVVSFVGSTGYSTGPHLHLEMTYNGSRVNPGNYIS